MKKTTIALILMTLAFISSANSQVLEVNATDTEAGTRFIKTKNHVGEPDLSDSVAKSGALFFSAGYQGGTVSGKTVETYFIELEIVHNDHRLGCLKSGESTIILKMADGSVIECFQISDSDCDKVTYRAAFALMGKKGTMAQMSENLQKLTNTEINEVKVVTTEGSLVYKIKQKEKQNLKNHFALVDKTVKSGSVAAK